MARKGSTTTLSLHRHQLIRTESMKPIVVVGAGGFGREVLEIFKDQNKLARNWDILGFIDDDDKLKGSKVNGFPVLGGLDWLTKGSNRTCSCVCAIGTSETRKSVIQILDRSGISYVNAIHPSVIMSDSIGLGHDVIICAGSILTVNITIGNHTHININSTIGHDAVIGPFCTISPSVNINGHNRLGEGVFVGTGAVFAQDVSVGDWAVIGAGAAVIDDIPEKVTAVGVPARPVRRR
jgi:sugar O-acyltransferase (sialic acid O-acetyltransferase NeuD family)